MKIVNPLYDKAFKYLMQNDRLAKRVLEVILDQEIEDLSLEQQELVTQDNKRNFALFRLDFKATIRDKQGKKQTVLIELQKSKYVTDLIRFRNYLGANYLSGGSKDIEHITTKKEYSESIEKYKIYPIITIYILGYIIEEIPFMAVNVEKCVFNSVNTLNPNCLSLKAMLAFRFKAMFESLKPVLPFTVKNLDFS